MPKHCEKCGKIKNITFNCDRCNKRVCLNCFDFVSKNCVDCVVILYNQKYEAKINAYAVAK